MSKNLYTNVHTSIIGNSQKVGTHVSIHQWMDKQNWYIYSMEYYSAMKRNAHKTGRQTIDHRVKEARHKGPHCTMAFICKANPETHRACQGLRGLGVGAGMDPEGQERSLGWRGSSKAGLWGWLHHLVNFKFKNVT